MIDTDPSAGAGNSHWIFVGIALGLCASLCFNVGLAIQKRAAAKLPPVSGPKWAALRAFLTSRTWLFGNGLVAVGWILNYRALLWAPIGIVMPAIAAGVVFQPLLCVFWLKERLTRSEMIGVAACIAGIAMMAFSIDAKIEITSSAMNGAALSWSLASLVVLAILGVIVARRVPGRAEAGFASAAGFLYAASGILTKALGIFLAYEASYWFAGSVIAGLVIVTLSGLSVVQAAYQRGRAMVIIPLMNVIADFLPATLGPAIFRESWPHGAFAMLRVGALVAILAGVLLLVGRVKEIDEKLPADLGLGDESET